jgi:moderate conductance mechanosensitive channel
VHVTLAQSAERITAVCGRGDDLDPDLLCELLLRWTGNEVVARAAGTIEVILRVLVLLVLAYILTRIVRGAISRFGRTMERRIEVRLDRGEQRGTLDVERYRIRRFQRLNAAVGVIRGVAGAVIWTIALFAILDAIGVPLQPILAGAGLAGIVLGFGAQQLVRDVLAGIAMLIEDQYGVGDWIEVEGRIGQVERVGIRATSFRDLDGIMNHVLNGYLQRVGNLSQEWSRSLLDIPLALDSDVPTAKAIIHKVASSCARIRSGEATSSATRGVGGPGLRPGRALDPPGHAHQADGQLGHQPTAARTAPPRLRARQHPDAGPARRGGRHAAGVPGGDPAEPGAGRGLPPPSAGLVPADVGPLDRPPATGPVTDPQELVDSATGEHDHYDELPDSTTELRLERGSQPRPD